MSKKRTAKYQKREAKSSSFPYKAKYDIMQYRNDDESHLMFSEGNTYIMEVNDMYSYTTESELEDNTYLTREYLKEHFEEVTA